MIASLEHPGIVPVHDYGLLADGRPFYVMKRVDGRTLAAHISRTASRSPSGSASSSASAKPSRSRSARRRPPRPEAVERHDRQLRRSDGDGFGVARHGAARRRRGTVIGKAGFMAPEQAAGGWAEPTRARMSTPLARSLRDAAGRAPRPCGRSRRRALADAPADRYATVDAMAADVGRFRDGVAVLAHREDVLKRAIRVGRRYQLPILLVLAYIVMRR